MNSAVDQDVASKIALTLVQGRPAEFRSVTDIVSPLSLIYDLKGSTTLSSQTPVAALYFDPWLFETLFVINSYRDVSDGWDGDAAPAPTQASLRAAEMLTAFLALSEPEFRPTLCVDAFGRPAFATNKPKFYIHLTVDEAGRLTWYAVSNGVEYFADEVSFDGRRLPEVLGSLFRIST
jgi:hypothetical protein